MSLFNILKYIFDTFLSHLFSRACHFHPGHLNPLLVMPQSPFQATSLSEKYEDIYCFIHHMGI